MRKENIMEERISEKKHEKVMKSFFGLINDKRQNYF